MSKVKPENRVRNLSRQAVFRAKRTTAQKFGDVEVRQLKSLMKAYAGSSGPELLIFGDSAMFWTARTDPDRRHLVDLVVQHLGGKTSAEVLVGPGYNPRVVMAFLSALEQCPGRPKLVIAPTSVLMCGSLWINHPSFSYEVESKHLIEMARGGETTKLNRAPESAFEEYDRLPAPSLYGARRTAGELRLIVGAAPQTKWQNAVRTRHLMDYYNAEALTPDLPGVQLVRDLGARLTEMNLPSVAYIAPVNHEVLKTTLGADAVDHLKRNADVIAESYAAGCGDDFAARARVVNGVASSPNAHFADPVHLNFTGREAFAELIAQSTRELLD